MKKYIPLILLLLPLVSLAQTTPADSLKKYRPLALQARDSLKVHPNDAHWFYLCEGYRAQIDKYKELQEAIDAQKRRKKP
jgi:hypothetical protein